MPDTLARACADAMLAGDRASASFGTILDSVATGRATMSMKVLPEMANGLGICHGGLIFTLGDAVIPAARTTGRYDAHA